MASSPRLDCTGTCPPSLLIRDYQQKHVHLNVMAYLRLQLLLSLADLWLPE